MMKKIIAVLFIIIGLLIIFLPKISNFMVEKQTKSTVEFLEKIDPAELEKNNEAEAIYDYDSVSELDVYESVTNLTAADKTKIIGQVISPEIGMNIAIFKGINNTNLLVGAGTMKPNQKMGKGNYAIAAHYSPEEGVLFNKILDVKKGTKFFLTNKKKIYEYVVVSRETVPDTAVEMVEDSQTQKYGAPLLSLMTCPITSKTGKRVFAVCKLVDEYPYEGNIDKIRK